MCIRDRLKTGAVADVDVKVRGTDEALVNILTSVTNRPDSKSNFQSIDQSIEVKCFEDIIREVTNIIKAGVELEDTNPAYTTSVTDETDEVEPEDSASCDHVETILESDDDDDDDDDDYSVVSDSTVSSIYSTDGQGEGDVTDVFPKGPGDGFPSEFLSSSGADFPGLTTADDEAEEEEETEVTLVQHAAQTSSIIVQKAYYASTCGSL